jgi:hypothetical protein
MPAVEQAKHKPIRRYEVVSGGRTRKKQRRLKCSGRIIPPQVIPRWSTISNGLG